MRVLAFDLLLILAPVLMLAKTVTTFAEMSLESTHWSWPPEVAADVERDTVDLEALSKRNLFRAKRDAVQAPPPKSFTTGCAASTLPTRLLATLVSSDETRSVATFLDGATKAIVERRIAERIADRAVVRSIGRRRVALDVDGRCEMLTLDEHAPPKNAGAERPTTAKNSELGRQIQRVAFAEYRVPAEERDHILSNLATVATVATQARIVPSFVAGRPNGFKLHAVRPNGLYPKLGLRSGDIIQRINGYELGRPEKILGLFPKLKSARTLTVDFTRAGRPTTFRYDID